MKQLNSKLLFMFLILLSCCGIDNNGNTFFKKVQNKITNTKPLPKNDYKVNYINEESIIGIDISHHQNKIDWSKVKKWKNHNIKFVYIKATEGATGHGSQDPRYKENIEEAKKHGFLVGSYHYFRTTSSIEDQFENFISRVKKTEQDLIPMIDLEENKNWSKTEYRTQLKSFLALIESHFGKKPLIYSVTNFYNTYLAYHFLDYKVLLGFYNLDYQNIYMKDKHEWTAWQFSQQGEVKGIPKKV